MADAGQAAQSPAPPNTSNTANPSANTSRAPTPTANGNSYAILPPNFPTPRHDHTSNANSPAPDRRPSNTPAPLTPAAASPNPSMGPPQPQSAAHSRAGSVSGQGGATNGTVNGQQQQQQSYNYPTPPQQQSFYPHPFPPSFSPQQQQQQQQTSQASSTSGAPSQQQNIPAYPPPNFPWAPNGNATPGSWSQSPASPWASGQSPSATGTTSQITATPAPAPKPKKPKKKPTATGPDGTPAAKPTKKQQQAAATMAAAAAGATGTGTTSTPLPHHPSQSPAPYPSILTPMPAPSTPANGFSSTNTASNDQQPRDARQVMDVLGGSGIDLQAEEEAMRARQGPPQPLAAAQQAYVNSVVHSQALPTLQLYPLSTRVHAIANQHDLALDTDVLNVLSSAARIRFRNLLEAMVAASRHRCWSTHQRPPPMHERVTEDSLDGTHRTTPTKKPMYHEELFSDPSAWVAAIEKADRGDEVRARKRRAQRQREALLAANGGASGGAGAGPSSSLDADGDESMTGGVAAEEMWDKKRKKPISARNMSEDVRRRLANNTAARALGGPATPQWMTMGAAGGSGGGFSASKKDDSATMGAASSPNGEGEGGNSPPTTTSSLPKPRFAPAASSSGGAAGDAAAQWAAARATANLAPTGQSGTPLGSSSNKKPINPHGWGDPALRALAKEEEARKQSRRVLLCDALHAIEMERKSGSGRGSGEVSAFKRRNGVGLAAMGGEGDSLGGSSSSGSLLGKRGFGV